MTTRMTLPPLTANVIGRKDSDVEFADALLANALKEHQDSGKVTDLYGRLSEAVFSDVYRILERMDESEPLFSKDKLAAAVATRLMGSVEKKPTTRRFGEDGV